MRTGCYIDFCRQTPSPLKTDMPSLKWVFRSFLQNYYYFSKNLFRNKTSVTSFVIKKGYINFSPKKLPFHKKWQNVPPEQFFIVSSENTAFSAKIIKHENI